jgi:hypothetical protein
MANIFEIATREKFRFSSPKGKLMVEDLWTLPLASDNPDKANLNDIAKHYYKKIKDATEVSFVERVANPETTASVKLEIIQRIIAVRQEEENVRKAAAENAVKRKARNDMIMSIIAEKQEGSLREKSLEELKKMLEDDNI